MTDNNKRILLGAVIILTLTALCYLRYKKYDVVPEALRADTQTAEQAVKSSVASVDGAKSQYNATKDKNIAKEKEVAQNAFNKACEDSSNDADAIIAWNELLTRARNSNRQRSGNNN